MHPPPPASHVPLGEGTGISKGNTLTWIYVEPVHFKKYYFPTLPGPVGLAEAPKQMPVLKGYTFRGKKGDLLAAFQLLYPGDMNKDVSKEMKAMVKADSKTAELTVGEWVVFVFLNSSAIFPRTTCAGWLLALTASIVSTTVMPKSVQKSRMKGSAVCHLLSMLSSCCRI